MVNLIQDPWRWRCLLWMRRTVYQSGDMHSDQVSECVFVCLPIFLSSCLSASLIIYLSVCLCVYVSVCLSVCLSVSRSFCLSFCLSVCLSMCLSVSLSACLSVHISIYQSICAWCVCTMRLSINVMRDVFVRWDWASM